MRRAFVLPLLLLAPPVSAASGSSPLCLLPDPDVLAAQGDLLISPGRTDVPTNAFLFRSAGEPVPGWRALVRRDTEQTGQMLESEGGEGPLGRMDLLADTAYAVDVWDLDDEEGREPRSTLTFTTGAGADTEPPAPPEIVDEDVRESAPSLPHENECGIPIAGREAATELRWEFTGEPGTTALLFDVAASEAEPVASGSIYHRGEPTGGVMFRTAEPGIREMGLVLEDLAGNHSEMLIAEVDFGGCGTCTQSSLAPSALALVALRFARRRRRGP